MKLVLLSLAVLGCVAADDGAFRPKGALLVLPKQFSPSSALQEQPETLDRVSEKVMERLRQEQGSQTGNYHVYLSDGRLQKVQYTAAPLRTSSASSQTASNSNAYQTSGRYEAYQPQDSERYTQSQSESSYSRPTAQEPNPVVAHFGRLQQERLQQQLQQLQQQQEQLKKQADDVQQQLKNQQEFASNYVATVQFSDVPPIPAPIYSQNPAPITRILRHVL
uniref:Unkown protein n=1 Tax=Riptortus pedestris TaxID=329032 RepID=R4WNG1_RIPPE|nr:unkown protein [Riptortus pedestris]